jgi:predicted RecA/RadA family phage recombinase
MSNLSSTTPRPYDVLPTAYQDYPMDAVKIYEGSAVSDKIVSSANTGIAHTLVAAEDFLGFANATKDNSSGSSGSTTVNVIAEGVVQIPVTGVSDATKLGVTVYASDGNTFTLTSSSNSAVGKIVKYVSGSTCKVKFQGVGYRSV